MLFPLLRVCKRHCIVPKLPVALDDGVDDFATLHATLRGTLQFAGAVQKIHAEVTHHKSATSAAR
jgi:hypothetical protein